MPLHYPPLWVQTPWAVYTCPRVQKETTQSNNRSTYANVRTDKSQSWALPYGWTSTDPAHGETPPPLGMSPEVVKTHADTFCTGPRSKEVRSKGKRRQRERRNIQSYTVLHISTSGMSGIRPSNLALVTRSKCRSLSELYTVISVKSPIIVSVSNGSGLWPAVLFGSVPEPAKNPTRCVFVGLLPGPDINPRFFGRVLPTAEPHFRELRS